MENTVNKIDAGEVDARALSAFAYGAAATGVKGDSMYALFGALAKSAEWWLDEFNAENLAKTAWAFATMSYRDDKLFSALSRAAEHRLKEFNG